MKIGTVARKSGLDAKTIRYYESIGLVAAPIRSENGYRTYSERNLEELVFLRHARQFGFSIEECRGLIKLWRNPGRRSSQVHSLVAQKVEVIAVRIRELTAMKGLLARLLKACADDDKPDCAILDSLVTAH